MNGEQPGGGWASVPLWPPQQQAVDYLDQHRGVGGIWIPPRGGKTRAALVWLWKSGVQRALVVVIKSGPFIWSREAAEIGFPLPVTLVIDGSTQDKATVLRGVRAGVAVVLLPSYWRSPLREAILAWEPEAVIVDEAQNIRHRTSSQSKFAHVLATTARYRIGLSGTPEVQGHQDWFSLGKFIDRRVLGGSWSAFATNYIAYNPFTPFPKIDGWRNEDDLRTRIHSLGITITVDQKEPHETITPVALTPQSRTRYRQLQRDSLLTVSGRGESGEMVTGVALAQLAITQAVRLQTLTSGFIKTSEGVIVDLSSEKLEMAADIVQNALENTDQVVIACLFRRDVARVAERLGIPIAQTYTGARSTRERGVIVDDFQAGRLPVLVGQIKALSTSIELSAGTVGIVYSLSYKLDEFLQFRMRMLESRQQRDVLIHYLVATDTVDEKIMKALQKKHDLAARLRDPSYAKAFFQ